MFNYQKIEDPFLIYVIKFSGKVDRNDIDSYKKSLKKMLIDNKFYYIIFDIIEVGHFKTKYMMELFSEIKNIKEEFRSNMKGCSIITNKFCETALNFIFMIVKPLCESKIVRNMNDAIKFLCEIDIKKEKNPNTNSHNL